MPAVVSCILVKEGKILLLQRSQEVGTYKGLWGGITGFVEPDETPLQTAIKEIYEETKISEHDIVLKQRLDPISFTDEYKGQQYDWFVHPFIFLLITEKKIQLDWEHVGYQWINPGDIERLHTVPRLKEIVEKVFP